MDRAVNTPTEAAVNQMAAGTVAFSLFGLTMTDLAQVIMALCALVGAITTVIMARRRDRYMRDTSQAYLEHVKHATGQVKEPPQL